MSPLTNATKGEDSRSVFWWFAFREERLQDVDAEGQGHYRLRTWPDYHALYPKPNESHKWSKSLHYIGVISAAFSYHSA